MKKKRDAQKENEQASKLGKSSHFKFKLLPLTNTTNTNVNQREFQGKKAKLNHFYKTDTTVFFDCFSATEQFLEK